MTASWPKNDGSGGGGVAAFCPILPRCQRGPDGGISVSFGDNSHTNRACLPPFLATGFGDIPHPIRTGRPVWDRAGMTDGASGRPLLRAAAVLGRVPGFPGRIGGTDLKSDPSIR